MKSFPKPAAGILVTALVLFTSTAAMAQNTVTDWNAIAITNARASTAPGAATPGGTNIYVTYAELAVYNAVVAIQGGYQPYKYNLTAPAGASVDAAVIEAAYRTLVHVLPDRFVPLTTAYTASLAAIPDGAAKLDGQSVGLESANDLIALRAGDGLGGPWPYSFPSSPVPGVWILTPGTTAPATPWVGQMRPFTFDDPSEFMPDEPPPALDSLTWADDYNQVKTLGAANSTVRTPEQTEIGRFWLEHPGAQYGALLRLLVMQENLSLIESSRLMAMAYTSMADGYIGCFNAKYHFSFWRPVTAIRNGDIDGNPDTIADPTWSSLTTTPGHPEYPSAHGCVTGGLADALQAYFGTPRMQLSIFSSITNTTHHFSSIQDLQREVEYARIYAGFHYHHSMIQGFVLGHKVAHNVANNYFQPVR
jgi:hypothetical protein